MMVLGVSLAAVFYKNYIYWPDRLVFIGSFGGFVIAHLKGITSIKLFYILFLAGLFINYFL